MEDKIEEQYNKMVSFVKKFDLLVYNKHTLYEWAKIIVEKENGGCFCNSDRKRCPCPQAISEIYNNGWCACKFFASRKNNPCGKCERNCNTLGEPVFRGE